MLADLFHAVPWWVWAAGLNVASSIGVYLDLLPTASVQERAPHAAKDAS